MNRLLLAGAVALALVGCRSEPDPNSLEGRAAALEDAAREMEQAAEQMGQNGEGAADLGAAMGALGAAMTGEESVRAEPVDFRRLRELLPADAAGLAQAIVPGHDPPARMAAVVRARDGTCRFPSCRAPATRCDIDHTRRHPEGPTTIRNLACLCRRHHRLKHVTTWQVDQLDHGVLRWTSPTEHTYLTYPSGPLADPRPD